MLYIAIEAPVRVDFVKVETGDLLADSEHLE
jgi:hypothetical protein